MTLTRMLCWICLAASVAAQLPAVFTTTGPHAGSRFGAAVEVLEDLNGDGIPELVVGCPDFDAVWRYGAVMFVDGASGETLHVHVGTLANGRIGSSLAVVEDLDFDGVRDVVSDVSSTVGALVLSGADGSVIMTGQFNTVATGILLGETVAMGDVNGDGFADFARATPADGPTPSETGAVYVYSGDDGSILLSVPGASTADRFGEGLAGGADMNGDGVPDLIVGASQSPVSPLLATGAGYFSIRSGVDGTEVLGVNGVVGGSGFGSAIELIGDVDGDGVEDLAVGAPAEAVTGAVHAFGGAFGNVLWSAAGPAGSSGFGATLARLPDLDGDDVPEVAVAASGGQTSVIRILSGATGAVVTTHAHQFANYGVALVASPLPGDRHALVVGRGPAGIVNPAGAISVLADAVHVGCGVGAQPLPFLPPDELLRVNGRARTGRYRTVSMPPGWPLVLSLDPPVSTVPAAFALWAHIGFPALQAFESPVGTMCFAPTGLSSSPEVVLLADSIGFSGGSALLPSTPAPWSAYVPSAPDLTTPIALQGIVQDGGTSSGLRVTNAVVLTRGPVPPPRIDSVTPLHGPAGTVFTIAGRSLGAAALTLGGLPVQYSSLDDSVATFVLPFAMPCDTPLVVTDPAGRAASVMMNASPVITSAPIASGPAAGGSQFVLVGAFPGNGTTVTIGGTAATVVIETATAILGTTPPGSPGSAQIVVTTTSGCTTTATYTYL